MVIRKRGTVLKEDGSLGLGPRILGGMAGGVMSRDGKINEVGGSERYWEVRNNGRVRVFFP